MYPYPFVPWVWRDPDLWGYFGEEHATEVERERRAADLAGYKVEALDGEIGSVDRASYATGDSWLVVDTGPWIFGRKVLLPAGTVQHIDHIEGKMYIDRDKAQVEHSPSYDPETFDDPEYRARVARYYEQSYETAS